MSLIEGLKEEQIFRGAPVLFEDLCMIYPPTVGDIFEITIAKFQEFLGILTIEEETYKKEIGREMEEILFLIANCIANQDFHEKLVRAFSFFIKEEVVVLPDLGAFLIGAPEDKRFLTRENFPKFQLWLRQLTGLEKELTERAKVEGKVKEILDKIRKGQKKIQELKGESGNELSLVDLVSAFAIEMGVVDLEKIYEMPYVTFQTQFRRARMREEYNLMIKSALAGAKIEEENKKNWIRKIQD